jgi:HEAT repeat protein
VTTRSIGDPMPVEQAALVAEFARTCKAAARSVSLYPPTHPAIRGSLARVSSAAERLTAAGNVTLTVHPDQLVIDGRSAVRPDPAIAELAALLHERLVGELTIERAAADDDWLALLLVLARAPDDLIADGGIGRAWAASGRSHFAIREIDYAEVLRERAGGHTAEWDRIIAFCLQGDPGTMDERALASLLDAVGDPQRFGELIDRLENGPASKGASIGARAAALLQLLRTAVSAAEQQGPGVTEQALDSIAASSAKLTPEMMLAVLAQRRSPDHEHARVATAVVDRMSDGTIASFVAHAVAAEHKATERLAQAFEALVPESDRKDRLLDMAESEARATPLGADTGFEELWQNAANMLKSYSDKKYVSEDYGLELSTMRTQAIQVEHLSDDPPERLQTWLATVSDDAIRQLDASLLMDLLHIESEPAQWQDVAFIAATEVERRALLGDLDAAQHLIERMVAEAGADGRQGLQHASAAAREKLASGPLIRHLVQQLRRTNDQDVKMIGRLCHAIGPPVVRPLAEALAVEEDKRAIRALREILLGFGAAGRQSVEQLKTSSNPAVRRTAIDLLRVFGGNEALPELVSMLGDADPEVQRDSIRAIVQIGSRDAYSVLERAIVAGGPAREMILQQLLELRDDKSVPLLCYVLNHTEPRGTLTKVHADVIDALGSLSVHAESIRTLRRALYRGEWWAPFRTAALRRSAAAALRRIGTEEARAVLEEAARTGSRGVRSAARVPMGATPRRERDAPPAASPTAARGSDTSPGSTGASSGERV